MTVDLERVKSDRDKWGIAQGVKSCAYWDAVMAYHVPDLVAEIERLRGVLAGLLGAEAVTVDQAMALDEALGDR